MTAMTTACTRPSGTSGRHAAGGAGGSPGSYCRRHGRGSGPGGLKAHSPMTARRSWRPPESLIPERVKVAGNLFHVPDGAVCAGAPRCELLAARSFVVVGAGHCPVAAFPTDCVAVLSCCTALGPAVLRHGSKLKAAD